MSNKILKQMLEVHKPSSQISGLYTLSGKPFSLQPFQHDVMNYFCYIAREQILIQNDMDKMLKTINSEDELFDFLRVQKIEIDLKKMIAFTKKYKTIENRKNMIDVINQLSEISITVGQFKSDDLMITDKFSLISRIKRITNSNSITIWLEPELILGWIFNPKPFAKLYLKIQVLLTKTYTKMLYEICKDYIKLGKVTKHIELWKQVLQLKGNNVSRLKCNYLNKSIIEINEKTDIKITDISGKKINGITMMTVEFEKQSKNRLQELGLIEEDIITHKFYNKSKSKMDKLIKKGYKVIDEDMWIQTDIKKNEDRYESEIRIDKWLHETTNNDQNELFEILAQSIEHCDDPIVTIEDYKIIGVFSKDSFTSNPAETIKLLNETINDMNVEN